MTGHRDTISVLIADDHQVVRAGLRAFFAATPDLEVVAEAADGEAAVAAAERCRPDVALIDLLMPVLGGVACLRGIRQVSPDTKLVVLTSYHRDRHIFPAIRAGATAYLLKDVAPEEIAATIRRSVQGEATLHPRVAARVVEELQAGGAADGTPMALTPREREVLDALAWGRSNQEIAVSLHLSEKTVKRHVSNILGKLQVTDRTQAAVFAWQRGLVDDD